MTQSMQRMTLAGYIFLASCAAWSLSIAAHELIGHGGVCAISPTCSWVYADAMYFTGTEKTGHRRIAEQAAGSILNILVGLFLCGILLIKPSLRNSTQIFLQLMIAVSFIQSGAYIAFGPMIHTGMDWSQIAAASDNQSSLEHCFLVTGLLVIGVGVLASKYFRPIFRPPQAPDLSPAFYTLISYLGFGLTAFVASMFVPAEDRLFMLAGGLGGGAGFMAYYLLSLLPILPARHTVSAQPDRACQYVALSIIFAMVTVLYIFVLGRGVNF